MPSTICLNMIVKNEERIISRALKSVIPYIDHWVIMDTGSTDNTKKLINAHLRNIPGELHDRPWKDFGHNRSEAIQLAKGKTDYILILDADDWIDVPVINWNWPDLQHDAYELMIYDHGEAYGDEGVYEYPRIHIIRNDGSFVYADVRHEYIDRPGKESTLGGLTLPRYHRGVGGNRSKNPSVYLDDAKAIEEAMLEARERTPRRVYYLAQSYRDGGNDSQAMKFYIERASMLGGYEDEVYISFLEAGRCAERLGKPDIAMEYYGYASRHSTHRGEALCDLARMYNELNKFDVAYATASRIPYRWVGLIADASVWRWRAKDVLAVAAQNLRRLDEAKELCELLLMPKSGLPASERARVQANLQLCITP